ncbi:unnamed protein product [Caenorhabditis brenneri]
MANAHSFPLLRLPGLAREHVLKVMDVREQYLFSRLSKKSKRIAKNGIRLISYVYKIVLSSEATLIDIRQDWSREWFRFVILPIENVQHNISLNEMVFKVDDFIDKSIDLLIFLEEQFNISRFTLRCEQVLHDCIVRFIASVKKVSIKIYELDVYREEDEVTNDTCLWVMDNCRDVKRLTITCATTADFEWDSQESFTSEYCSLLDAPWLTVDHITRIFWNCRFFEVVDERHKMTSQDMSQLIKLWMEGSKLEFIEIGGNELFDFDQVMNDIEKEPVIRAHVMNEIWEFREGEAFKIVQNNGTEAVVCIAPGGNFILTTHFDNPRCDFWNIEGEEVN